jgi:hypothetical protein
MRQAHSVCYKQWHFSLKVVPCDVSVPPNMDLQFDTLFTKLPWCPVDTHEMLPYCAILCCYIIL